MICSCALNLLKKQLLSSFQRSGFRHTCYWPPNKVVPWGTHIAPWRWRRWSQGHPSSDKYALKETCQWEEYRLENPRWEAYRDRKVGQASKIKMHKRNWSCCRKEGRKQKQWSSYCGFEVAGGFIRHLQAPLLGLNWAPWLSRNISTVISPLSLCPWTWRSHDLQHGLSGLKDTYPRNQLYEKWNMKCIFTGWW